MEDGQTYSIKYAFTLPGDISDINAADPFADPPHDDEEIMANGNNSDNDQYLVNDGDEALPTEADIDQIAAENLIFMAHDGQEIIRATGTDENGAVVVSASDGTPISQLQQAVAISAPTCNYTADYTENTPQMVTEEVITDDWVQHQGEERVEIAAEQIIGSSAQDMLEMDVPLPTVQDEYTALRPFPCDFCSRRFRKKGSLMNHMVAHQNDRPHLCKLCGSRFSRRSDLINHLKAHADVPDPDYEDTEFINFVEQQQRPPASDHFYEHDWSESEPIASIHHSKTSRITQQSTSNNIVSASFRTTATRGRISRLKPKKEVFVINEVESQRNERNHSDPVALEYVEASTASVKLSQDSSAELQQQQYPIIDDSKPFVCQQCGLAFAREKALSAHIKNHRNDAPYECNQCNEMFLDTASLHEHQKTNHFEESNSEYDPAEADATQSDSESEQLYGEFYCSECGMSFHRQDLLRRHIKSHIKILPANSRLTGDLDTDHHCCNTCGESFAEALDLLAHAEMHARFPPFKCLLCGESFFEEHTIKNHLTAYHAEEMGPNSCILCGKMCRDHKALIKHAWDHSREKSHTCSKCGKNFHNKARLKRHMTSHRDKSVICAICNEEFPDGRTLSNHRHSHSAASSGKLFPCNECGKTFGSRSSQQIHVRIHTGERPYGCRYCWKAFADGGTLRKHERIHTGEKPYACSVCPRAFNQRVVLREHIRSHHSSMDAKNGTYFCSVCSEELSTANDLIKHLIQHSDMNTAMKRQPITGPRKYKRRRKLKPHELEHLRHDSQQNGNDTDLDLSDFDMENVDDLLGITDAATNSNSNTNSTKNTTKRKIQTGKMNAKRLTTAGGRNAATYSDNDDNNSDNSAQVTAQRYDSQNEVDKLWQTKLINTNSNEETYKSLLSNLENTLQCIDTLVVSNNNNSDNHKNGGGQSEDTATAQRTQQVHIIKMESKCAAEVKLASARTRKKPEKNDKISRPRMIHTEKCHTNSAHGNKRRNKTFITRTDTAQLQLLPKSLSLVHDYEIMSPDTKPPKQISSSPQYIKQEHHQQHHNNHHHHHIEQHHFNAGIHSQRSVDLYDAQLLLETSTLRKEAYEKFNPSIVNDLEEILRSPDKSVRHRFTSESSNQYLVEEEQHMIKIEPTSPDLREIVANSTGVDTCEKRRSTRATRSANRKYLDFESPTCSPRLRTTQASTVGATPCSSKRNVTAHSRSRTGKNIKNFTKSATESRHVYNANNVHIESASRKTPVISTSSVSSMSDTTFPSIPTVPTSERKQRYFECEMCSAVFTDRAQLLDHVPIHI